MEAWDAMAPSVAVVLKTGSSVMSERLPNLLSDYLRRVPNLLVVSDAPAPSPEPGRPAVLDVLHGPAAEARADVDELAVAQAARVLEQQQQQQVPLPTAPPPSPPPEAEVGWEADRRKNIPAFVAAWARYPRRDWYIMVDDDTWLSLPNLAALLTPLNASEPHYLGNPYVISGRGCAGLRLEDGRLFNHGGSGIVLSRAAVELFVPRAPGCLRQFGECWAGDGMLGICLHSLGILPQRGDGLCGDSPFDFFRPDARGCPPSQPPPEHCVAPRPVSYHRIRESWQAKLLSEHDAAQRRTAVSLRSFLHGAGRERPQSPSGAASNALQPWAVPELAAESCS